VTTEAGMSAFAKLQSRLGAEWLGLAQAAATAAKQREQMLQMLQSDATRAHSDDSSVVVFGSLARNEATSGSDVDWTLLIDGQADPEHLRTAQWVAAALEQAKFTEPGPTGVFGNMAFSHEIIHQIGGQADTNRNTTQRILLLLESAPIGSDEAYDRVLRGVLYRYLEDDPSLLSPDPHTQKLPRFLLNDVVRFWRTMAVDYASKQAERARQGWAIRNIKLRMSRKLIFVKGLLVCFNCILRPPGGANGSSTTQDGLLPPLVSYLRRVVSQTPLEIVAQAWLNYPNDKSAKRMLDAYDEFVITLDDHDKRNHLKSLQPDAASTDSLFQRMREVGHAFQESLDDLFFETHELSNLVRKYGVF
jgi:predicted nucleotidyltransferase